MHVYGLFFTLILLSFCYNTVLMTHTIDSLLVFGIYKSSSQIFDLFPGTILLDKCRANSIFNMMEGFVIC